MELNKLNGRNKIADIVKSTTMELDENGDLTVTQIGAYSLSLDNDMYIGETVKGSDNIAIRMATGGKDVKMILSKSQLIEVLTKLGVIELKK